MRKVYILLLHALIICIEEYRKEEKDMSDKPYRFPEIDITKLRRQFDPCDDAQRIKPPLTRDTYPTCRAFSVAMGSVVLPHIDDSVQFDPKTRCPIGYRRITNVAMDLVDVED